jgi:hypothetical protein
VLVLEEGHVGEVAVHLGGEAEDLFAGLSGLAARFAAEEVGDIAEVEDAEWPAAMSGSRSPGRTSAQRAEAGTVEAKTRRGVVVAVGIGSNLVIVDNRAQATVKPNSRA